MKTFLTLTICFIFQMSNAQLLPWPAQSLKSDWQRIYLTNVGYIDIPNSMEIQSGMYKKLSNSLSNPLETDSPDIVFQQKGLNGFQNASFKKYGRILLHRVDNPYADYERLNFNLYNITETEMKEFDLMMKQKTMDELKTIGQKLISWYPLVFEKVNGMTCAHVKYKRQMGNNPVVLVHQYYFQNVDTLHILILSYRLSETDYWKSDFDHVLSSFRITNVK